MEDAGCIKIAQSVGIGTHPGFPFAVLAKGEDGSLVQKMSLYGTGSYIK